MDYKKFERCVENYADKVYNFYYNVTKNHDFCIFLCRNCFAEIYEDFDALQPLQDCDIYKVATDILLDNKDYFCGKSIYYDFFRSLDFQKNIEKYFSIKLGNINFAMLKLEIEYKIVLALKYKVKLKNWEIAVCLGIRQEDIDDYINKARIKLASLLIK